MVDVVYLDPQLDFWSQLVWLMVDNTLDEDTEDVGVDGRWMRAKRGALGDHDLVKAPKYCGNGFLMRINGGGSGSPTRIRYATTEVTMTKNY